MLPTDISPSSPSTAKPSGEQLAKRRKPSLVFLRVGKRSAHPLLPSALATALTEVRERIGQGYQVSDVSLGEEVEE